MLDYAKYTLGELVRIHSEIQVEMWKRFSLPFILFILVIFAVSLIMNKRGK